MSLGSPDVQLRETTKCKLKLEKCILCHKVKDNQGHIKLKSTKNGRKTLVECLKVVKIGLEVGSRIKWRLITMSTPGTQSSTHDLTYFNVISDIR